MGAGLLSKIHVKVHVNNLWFSNMDSVLPANQMLGLKILLTSMDLNMGIT